MLGSWGMAEALPGLGLAPSARRTAGGRAALECLSLNRLALGFGLLRAAAVMGRDCLVDAAAQDLVQDERRLAKRTFG